MPGLREPLCSIPQICDHNFTAVFTRTNLNIYKDTDIQPVLSSANVQPVLQGYRDAIKMWRLPFHSPAIANTVHQINSAYRSPTK